MAGAKPDTWMPIFWGDYLRDTGHLSKGEHGAYLLLIGHYWTTGKPIPDKDAVLARITKQGLAGWRKDRLTIAPFFTIEEGAWHHGRIDHELDRAMRFIEKQAANGARGGRPLKDESQTKPKPNPDGNPNRNPTESTSPSPPNYSSHGDTIAAALRASASPDGPPRTGLTSREDWQKRIELWLKDGTWSSRYGLRPDSAGTNPIIPADLLQWAKAQAAQQRTGAPA